MNNELQKTRSEIGDVIGRLPYRMAFAGGWIDQPFVSQHNPAPPGSMVVVAVEPTSRFMQRCGMSTSTREIARSLWGDELPEAPPEELVKLLYEAENAGSAEPSGSQDMIGLIYPGINRLDYDFSYTKGLYPVHIESNNDPAVASWLESMIYMVPVAPRPSGYNPLGVRNLDGQWIKRLGETGQQCYEAICCQDLQGLGDSMNLCMRCWEEILPHTVSHPTIRLDLLKLLSHYQQRYAGAMYSGCGGGYIYVASDEPVPGGFQVEIRIDKRRNSL